MNADDLWASLAAVRFDDAAVEAAVEDRLVRPLIRAIGWPDDCVHAKVRAALRVGRKVQRGRKPEADFVLSEPTSGQLSPNKGYVVVETKRPDEDFADAREQAESYSFALRALLFVVCDGRRVEVWRTGWADDTKLIVEARIDQLQSWRAELERYLSPRAAREYHEQQRPTVIRGDYDLANYVEFIRARTTALSAIARKARMRGPGGVCADIDVDGSTLPSLIAAGTCSFLVSGTGRGKTRVLHLLSGAAIRPTPVTFLPILVSAEDITGSLLEAALDELRAHVPGLVSVAGVQRLFSTVPPLILLDDWHRGTNVHRRLLAEFPLFFAAHGAVVLASAHRRAVSSIATYQLVLDRYSPTERDAVVARRTDRISGPALEARLAPELQPLAREPLFLDLLVDALRTGPRTTVTLPPNLTELMQRLLEVVAHRENALPVDMLTCIGARVAGAHRFGLAEIQRAIGECGGESGAAALAEKMTLIGVWEQTSAVGDYSFSNVGWQAYFKSCAAFGDPPDWARWVREAPLDELELGVPYAAHMAATHGVENDFFRQLLDRDLQLYMRSLGARADGVRVGANDAEQALNVLRSLRSGYEDVVDLLAPALRHYLTPWVQAMTDEERAGRLCVDGTADNENVTYSFGLALDEAEELVSLEHVLDRSRPPRRAPSGGFTRSGISLRLSQIRVDSGRLVATRSALGQIREVVERKKDGPLIAWLSRERMAELLRALHKSGHLADDITAWTVHELTEWVHHPDQRGTSSWDAGVESVRRDELLRVSSSMVDEGYAGLRFAEMDISRPRTMQETHDALRRLFDAVIETYKSACEAWFPHAMNRFTYGFGPFRFGSYLEHDGVTYWLEPVEEWGTASEVTALASTQMPPPWEDIVREIERKASELGREPLRSVCSSSRLVTDWHAPVTREVRALLKGDIEAVERWIGPAT